jgi:hypothetical protein
MKHFMWSFLTTLLVVSSCTKQFFLTASEELLAVRNNNGARSKVIAVNARTFMGAGTTVSIQQAITTEGKYYLLTENIILQELLRH